MEGMEGIEVSTEAMTLENAVELVRETDSGVISDWLKGLLPWFLNFGFQILLAVDYKTGPQHGAPVDGTGGCRYRCKTVYRFFS